MASDADFSSSLRSKLAKMSLRPVRVREEKEHALFSPTHFSVDLFAPHATTEQVVGEPETPQTPEMSCQRQPSADSGASLSPRGQAVQMMSMLDALQKLNTPGAEELTEEEWAELAIMWSVPIAGAQHDLVPGGRDVPVKLCDKDKYCMKAKEALEVCVRQADLYS
eukprot:TRINITY_DN11001_c0_g1_i1.p1 TRINITY_DN11001_c0_g1~~TRINITY_DN11001_c0_g1_i1.p1  ORF type:complete len:166 (+),score=34.02 TRINITY_DN11001_c0_g1_i1:74-571(+)